MIAVDWGTTSFRAYRLAGDGGILDRRVNARGIMAHTDGGFADTLREAIGPWLAAGETRVLMAGMIGSRQGWLEAPYLPCPVGPADLAAGLVAVPFEGAQVKVVPGVSGVDEAGVAEVMRGEETQVAGAFAATGGTGTICLPGTHSKWVRTHSGRLLGFTTHMTGEVFAALRGHTILGRMMRDGPAEGPFFDEGVRRSAEPGGLLHHAFGVRALTLTGRLPETDAPAYLSGLLIGHEVRSALSGDVVHIIGAAGLDRLYARAISLCGAVARIFDGDAAAEGLARIGAFASWN
jgi:2-dehydro-3-deoxygalactonokinase